VRQLHDADAAGVFSFDHALILRESPHN
jgi:hypothetical protein